MMIITYFLVKLTMISSASDHNYTDIVYIILIIQVTNLKGRTLFFFLVFLR